MIEQQIRKSVQFTIDLLKESKGLVLSEADTIDRISTFLTESGDKPTVINYLEWKKRKGLL